MNRTEAVRKVELLRHPVAQALLTECRDAKTPPRRCREIVHALSRFLAIQATSDIETRDVRVITPLKTAMVGNAVHGSQALVPILRAGAHLIPGFHELLPDAVVWHIGQRRNEEPPFASELYLNKVPPADVVCGFHVAFVLDVMLATGGSASTAIQILKEREAARIVFVGVLAAPEGIQRLTDEHPDIDIHLIEVDERLNEHGYIVPGLGDAGDRLDPTE